MEDGRRHCTASREPYFFTWHLRDTSRLYESSQYWSQNECWWDPCLNLYGVLTRLILVPHSSHLLPGMHSPPLQAYATGGPVWRLASTGATKDACRTFGVRSIPLSSKRRHIVSRWRGHTTHTTPPRRPLHVYVRCAHETITPLFICSFLAKRIRTRWGGGRVDRYQHSIWGRGWRHTTCRESSNLQEFLMTWYAAPGTSQAVPATVARTCRIQGTTQEPAR